MGAFGYLLDRQIVELSAQMTRYTEAMRRKVAALRLHTPGFVDEISRTADTLARELDEEVEARRSAQPVRLVSAESSLMARLGTALAPVAAPLARTLVVVVLVIFLLARREDIDWFLWDVRRVFPEAHRAFLDAIEAACGKRPANAQEILHMTEAPLARFDEAGTFGTAGEMLSLAGKLSIRAQGILKIQPKFVAGHMSHPSGPAAPISGCGLRSGFNFSAKRTCARLRRDRTVPIAQRRREAASAYENSQRSQSTTTW